MDKRIYIANLIESDLDRAEVVLAAKAIGEEAQAMAEKIAKMQVNELMPLVDRIKETIGQQEAEVFNQAVSHQLDQLLDLTKSTKEEIENQVLVLNGESPGGLPQGDPMSMGADQIGGDDIGADPMGGQGAGDMSMDDLGMDDEFGGAEANSGKHGSPIGRGMREAKKAKLAKGIATLSEAIMRMKQTRR